MKWVGKWIDTMLDLEGGQKDSAGVPLSHAQGFGLYPEGSKEPLKDSKLASGEICFIFLQKKVVRLGAQCPKGHQYPKISSLCDLLQCLKFSITKKLSFGSLSCRCNPIYFLDGINQDL